MPQSPATVATCSSLKNHRDAVPLNSLSCTNPIPRNTTSSIKSWSSRFLTRLQPLNTQRTAKQKAVNTVTTMATQLIHSVRRSLVQPRHAAFLYYALLVLLADAALCQLIIRRVAFTEIDFATYLEQAALVFHKGERDYAKIRGDSGPLVYPAGHVAVFGAFHWLTKGGAGLWMAQQAFAIFYSVTQAVVMLLFYRADVRCDILQTKKA